MLAIYAFEIFSEWKNQLSNHILITFIMNFTSNTNLIRISEPYISASFLSIHGEPLPN